MLQLCLVVFPLSLGDFYSAEVISAVNESQGRALNFHHNIDTVYLLCPIPPQHNFLGLFIQVKMTDYTGFHYVFMQGFLYFLAICFDLFSAYIFCFH